MPLSREESYSRYGSQTHHRHWWQTLRPTPACLHQRLTRGPRDLLSYNACLLMHSKVYKSPTKKDLKPWEKWVQTHLVQVSYYFSMSCRSSKPVTSLMNSQLCQWRFGGGRLTFCQEGEMMLWKWAQCNHREWWYSPEQEEPRGDPYLPETQPLWTLKWVNENGS